MTAPRTARQAHHRPADWITIHPVGKCGCPRCRPTNGLGGRATAAPARASIELPTEPRRIRVHSPNRPPQDCTLHPDGTLTAIMHGRPYRNLCTFADMLEMNWKDSHIEWDPTDDPEPQPAHSAVQAEQTDLFQDGAP